MAQSYHRNLAFRRDGAATVGTEPVPGPPVGFVGSKARPAPAGPAWLQEAEAYEELGVSYDRHARLLWLFMRPQGRPSITSGLLRDMRRAQHWIESVHAEHATEEDAPFRYVVLASRMPGIFNLGGNLPLFVGLIRAGDRAGLRRYAHACVDVQYRRAVNMDLPIMTISLVQGDALGGGFEAALTDDLIIAERSAKFGLPEILFNLFPGMGAYSLLCRRLDATRAERLILSGQVYTAEALHEMGVVDILADDGRGEEAVYDYIEQYDRTYNARQALYRARRTVYPVTREELIAVTEIWVDAALNLDAADLRKMERLANAQDRRWTGLCGKR